MGKDFVQGLVFLWPQSCIASLDRAIGLYRNERQTLGKVAVSVVHLWPVQLHVSVYVQCEAVETELTANLQVQRQNLSLVIDVLHSYGTIIAQFGQAFADNTRTNNYLTWLQELVSDFSESK